jgi:hypothetical protein
MSHVITIIKHLVFTNLSQKIIIFLGVYIYFIIEFQNHGSKHDHGLL